MIRFASFLLGLLLLFGTTPTYAVPPTGGQGPGGFIPLGPTSDLVLWTNANTLGLANGANVDAWNDGSGRANNLGNRQNSVTYTLSNANFNSQSTVQFGNGVTGSAAGNATRGWLESPALLSDGTYAETLWVLSTPHDTNTNDDGNSGGPMRIGRHSNGHYTWNNRNIYENFSRDNNGRQNWNPTADLSAPHIYNIAGDDDARWVARINGNIERDVARDGASDYWNDVWYYGRSQHSNNGNGDWDGQVGEIIILNRNLNDAERVIMQNHLSSKYDIALGANDFYTGDTPGNGNYDFDVIGVGQAEGDQVTAAGAAGLGIEITSGLDTDGQFVMAGHDGSPNGITDGIWDRVWYLDTNGFDGDVTLAFDFSDAGLGAPEETEYSLLFNATDASDLQPIATEEIVGDLLSFNIPGADLQSGFISIGSAAVVPEPASVTIWTLLGMGLAGFGYFRTRRRT